MPITDPPSRHNAQLLMSVGWVAILGVVALVLGNIVGSVTVPGHDWVADTVSDLAAGKYEIIQDVALYGFAASLTACAIGGAHFHRDGARWNLGIACLSLLAMCVVIIGARNEYGDNDSDGIVIHIYVVYVIGLLFTALFLCMAQGMSSVSKRYGYVSYLCAALWSVGAPVFFFMPTGYDGAFERGLGAITIVWVLAFSWMLISAARDQT